MNNLFFKKFCFSVKFASIGLFLVSGMQSACLIRASITRHKTPGRPSK